VFFEDDSWHTDTRTGRMLASFERDDGSVRALDISGDGEPVMYAPTRHRSAWSP
jgi:hypothetical protein